MRSFEYTITDPLGIHARPAGILAKKAKEMTCEVTLQKGEKCVHASRLMSVMGLCVKCGDTVTVRVSGEREDEEIGAMEDFFKSHF